MRLFVRLLGVAAAALGFGLATVLLAVAGVCLALASDGAPLALLVGVPSFAGAFAVFLVLAAAIDRARPVE